MRLGSANACWCARVARAAWARANLFCERGASAVVGVISEEFGPIIRQKVLFERMTVTYYTPTALYGITPLRLGALTVYIQYRALLRYRGGFLVSAGFKRFHSHKSVLMHYLLL